MLKQVLKKRQSETKKVQWYKKIKMINIFPQMQLNIRKAKYKYLKSKL